jgi:hypothetical protein
MISEEKKAEFLPLFEEFVRDYLSLPQGQAHLSRYEAGRVQGRENFSKVATARDVHFHSRQMALPLSSGRQAGKDGRLSPSP